MDAPIYVGEYVGFKMSVSFDTFYHKFEMKVKGQSSHSLEIGSDPFGNISRINHVLESMPKRLNEAQAELANVERQLETAKVEVQKPFEKEQELSEKLRQLSALNALLNMDEKGDDVIGMDNEQDEQTEGENTKNPEEIDAVPETDRKPAHRESLKERLEAMKEQVVGKENPNVVKEKRIEETL